MTKKHEFCVLRSEVKSRKVKVILRILWKSPGFGLSHSLSLIFYFLLLTFYFSFSFADVYAPTDSIVLTVGCLDSTFLTVANPDSVWFKWWRDVGGQTIVDSAKVTTGLRTGFFRKKIKASDGSNNLGIYIAEAMVYKSGKTGIKTWSWTVKAETTWANLVPHDSTLIAQIKGKADSLRFDASYYVKSTPQTAVKINGGYAGQCTTLVNAVKINGGYAGQCSSLVNPVKVNGGAVNQCTSLVNGVTVSTNNDKTNYQLADNAITNAKIANSAITNSKIAINAIGADQLAGDAAKEVAESTWYADTSGVWNGAQNRFGYWNAQRQVGSGGGGGGSCDTVPIARYTWNYVTRTLTSGAGSGANSVVIRCKQSSDSTNIAGAQIQVLDSIQNSTIGLLSSDSQGRGFFALNNGTYCVRIYKPGWQFTVPETLTVNGNEDVIYYADVFDVGSPPQASLCRVYGWIYDINNQPTVGSKIEASIKSIPLRYQNIIISPYYKTTTTDDEGFWYLDLYPNSALSPSDTKYIFFIYTPSGTILKIETTIPNQGSWELQW